MSFKIAMSRWADIRQVMGGRHRPRLTFWLPFFQLYVTFILQWIAFIFERDEENEEKNQLVFHVQERQL